MMKFFGYGLIVALLLPGDLFSQKSPIKFGEINMEDLKMTVYPNDSAASAVYLVDYGKCYVTANGMSFDLNFERHFRVKILKKDGLNPGGPADVRIPLFKSGNAEEYISSLKAVTYNLENGVITETKLSKGSTFREKVNENIFLETFTLPNVKVGSVIEVSYNVNSDFVTNFHNWQFQYDIPVRRSEYWAVVPEYFVMTKYMQGYVPITDYESVKQGGCSFSK